MFLCRKLMYFRCWIINTNIPPEPVYISLFCFVLMLNITIIIRKKKICSSINDKKRKSKEIFIHIVYHTTHTTLDLLKWKYFCFLVNNHLQYSIAHRLRHYCVSLVIFALYLFESILIRLCAVYVSLFGFQIIFLLLLFLNIYSESSVNVLSGSAM